MIYFCFHCMCFLQEVIILDVEDDLLLTLMRLSLLSTQGMFELLGNFA